MLNQRMNNQTTVSRNQKSFLVSVASLLNLLQLDVSVNLKDIVKKVFEGTLRSILICQECGNKRVQLEPFMSISLPLSKEVAKLAKEIGDNKKKPGTKLTIDRCLRHFTLPELLADHVYCPSCRNKTPTRKQHVVSRLPKVLCLHLKRFDAGLNRKVDDFVSFPGRALNMGPYLPHW
jgi:ubiquitin C-terminal hydrolase